MMRERDARAVGPCVVGTRPSTSSTGAASPHLADALPDHTDAAGGPAFCQQWSEAQRSARPGRIQTTAIAGEPLDKGGAGRVPAVELLMVGYGARQHIRKNALQHLHQEITMSRRQGSVTFEESLAHLVSRGLLNVDEARARRIHRDELEGLLRSTSPSHR